MYPFSGTLLVFTFGFGVVAFIMLILAFVITDSEQKRKLRGVGYLAIALEMAVLVITMAYLDNIISALALAFVSMLYLMLSFKYLVHDSPWAIQHREQEVARKSADGGSDVPSGFDLED